MFCADDDRVYAYLRFETGDEMSRRRKFAFVTWIGPSVSPLKKAKVSTDKAFVKAICYVSLRSCTLDSLFTQDYFVGNNSKTVDCFQCINYCSNYSLSRILERRFLQTKSRN